MWSAAPDAPLVIVMFVMFVVREPVWELIWEPVRILRESFRGLWGHAWSLFYNKAPVSISKFGNLPFCQLVDQNCEPVKDLAFVSILVSFFSVSLSQSFLLVFVFVLSSYLSICICLSLCLCLWPSFHCFLHVFVFSPCFCLRLSLFLCLSLCPSLCLLSLSFAPSVSAHNWGLAFDPR